MVKQERIDGKLNEPEYIFTKVRHRPFSAYLRFLKPDELRGQETIYIAGPNGAKGTMWGHGTGVKKIVGTLKLDPTGPIAMSGNRYPITEIGILNLVRRLVEVGEKDIQYGECEVKFYPGAKINDRVCTCIQVVHPTARNNFLFHVAQDFRRRRAQSPDPVRGVRLAGQARRAAGTDRGVHVPQLEDQQPLHGRRFRHPQSGIWLQAIPTHRAAGALSPWPNHDLVLPWRAARGRFVSSDCGGGVPCGGLCASLWSFVSASCFWP